MPCWPRRSTVSADVATEVTAPAVLETLYELGRMASLPITAAELDSVQQYAIGSLALSTATQAGLASTITGLLAVGLDVEWLASHPARVLQVRRGRGRRGGAPSSWRRATWCRSRWATPAAITEAWRNRRGRVAVPGRRPPQDPWAIPDVPILARSRTTGWPSGATTPAGWPRPGPIRAAGCW